MGLLELLGLKKTAQPVELPVDTATKALLVARGHYKKLPVVVYHYDDENYWYMGVPSSSVGRLEDKVCRITKSTGHVDPLEAAGRFR